MRRKYKVPRPCHHCKGTGEGNCRVVCHVCNGDRVRVFELFASDLEGVTLVLYTRSPIDPSDPSNRVAPKMIESERRAFFHSSHAHETALEMMANGEIVSFAVKGWDDFAKLSPKDLGPAFDECSQLDERNANARRASEDCPWEAEEEAWAALQRLRLIEKDESGAMRLTERGVGRLNDAMTEKDYDTNALWVSQLGALVQRTPSQQSFTKSREVLDADDVKQERALKALEKKAKEQDPLAAYSEWAEDNYAGVQA